MNTINDGGPAFPRPMVTELDCGAPGMSLRDWFAGMALAGLFAEPEKPSKAVLALWAYEMADAMIAERNRGKEI